MTVLGVAFLARGKGKYDWYLAHCIRSMLPSLSIILVSCGSTSLRSMLPSLINHSGFHAGVPRCSRCSLLCLNKANQHIRTSLRLSQYSPYQIFKNEFLSLYQASLPCSLTSFVRLMCCFAFVFVPRAGVEPARPNGHMALNHACLPISAPGQCRMPLGGVCDPAGTRTQDPLIKSEML